MRRLFSAAPATTLALICAIKGKASHLIFSATKDKDAADDDAHPTQIVHTMSQAESSESSTTTRDPSRVHSYHIHLLWRTPEDEETAFVMLREFIKEFFDDFLVVVARNGGGMKEPRGGGYEGADVGFGSGSTARNQWREMNIERHMKGDTAAELMKLMKTSAISDIGNSGWGVGPGLTGMCMDEVVGFLNDKPTSELGPFQYVVDAKNPEGPVLSDLREFSIHVPVVEDKSGTMFDRAHRWWQSRLYRFWNELRRQGEKNENAHTLSLLIHPNTGMMWKDHTEWLWQQQFGGDGITYQFKGRTSPHEPNAQRYLIDHGHYVHEVTTGVPAVATDALPCRSPPKIPPAVAVNSRKPWHEPAAGTN